MKRKKKQSLNSKAKLSRLLPFPRVKLTEFCILSLYFPACSVFCVKKLNALEIQIERGHKPKCNHERNMKAEALT